MELQEEYFGRRKIDGHLFKYVVERAHLILRAKDENAADNWLHLNISQHSDGSHPTYYNLHVAANPVIYANSDFQHFTYQYSKVVLEQRLEFDSYELFLMDWITKNAANYVAIPATEAVFVSWSMFCQNYDSWLANYMTWKMIDLLKATLIGEKEARLEAIKQVEDWIRDRHERVYTCWKNIRANLEQRNYADWLAAIFNRVGQEKRQLL